MPDITKGTTFTSGQTVTAAILNSLVDDATINDNAINADKLAANAVTNAKVSGSAGIDYSKLAALTSGNVVVGDVNNVAAGVEMTGDITISNAGVSAIGTDKVVTANILAANVTTAKLEDSTGASDGVTTAKLATGAVTGPKIAMTSDAQGDVIFRGASSYERLGAGTAGQVLESGGADADPSWTDSGPKGITVFEYTDGSDQTFTVPAKVTSVKVTVVGGGGGGTGTGSSPGAGGGGGGTAIAVVTGLVPAATVNVTVGAGGVQVWNPGGVTGGTSYFGSSGSPHCEATGGVGAISSGQPKSAGGVGTVGDVKLHGGHSIANSDLGGNSTHGYGGHFLSGGNAAEGTGYGAGGGGSNSEGYGSDGTDGVVIVEY